MAFFGTSVMSYSVPTVMWTLQGDKEAGNAKASEDMVKAEDDVKGEADIKEGETVSAHGEAELGSEPKQNGSIELDKPHQDGKEEAATRDADGKQKGIEEVKKEEGKKLETKKEVKEQLPEKPTLQLHGKHSLTGKYFS